MYSITDEVTANTAKIQNWRIEILNPGKSQKCKMSEAQKCPNDILLVRDKTVMCYWLCKFMLKKAKDEWARIYYLQSILATASQGYKGICKSTKMM